MGWPATRGVGHSLPHEAEPDSVVLVGAGQDQLIDEHRAHAGHQVADSRSTLADMRELGGEIGKCGLFRGGFLYIESGAFH